MGSHSGFIAAFNKKLKVFGFFTILSVICAIRLLFVSESMAIPMNLEDKLERLQVTLTQLNLSTRYELLNVFRKIYRPLHVMTVDYGTFHPHMGLGNILFLYASLLGIASQQGFKPVILGRPHFKLFDLLNIQADIVPSNMKFQQHSDYENSCCSYISRNLSAGSKSSTNHIITRAYLQSYKYFAHISDYLKMVEFRFQPHILQPCERKMAKLKKSYCGDSSRCLVVGVHIRRGDILKEDLKNYGFRVADSHYILRAFNYYTSKYPTSKLIFAVLGNDFTWNYDNVRNLSEKTVVVYRNSVNPALDLCFLSRSDLMIITTGTFGWWAAYLAGRNVVYSKEYATVGTKFYKEISAQDFFPPNWVPL